MPPLPPPVIKTEEIVRQRQQERRQAEAAKEVSKELKEHLGVRWGTLKTDGKFAAKILDDVIHLGGTLNRDERAAVIRIFNRRHRTLKGEYYNDLVSEFIDRAIQHIYIEERMQQKHFEGPLQAAERSSMQSSGREASTLEAFFLSTKH